MLSSKRCFSAFQIALLASPAAFLLYLNRFWTWFLYPLPTNGLEYVILLLFIWWLIGLWKFQFPRPHWSSRWQWMAAGFFLMAITLGTVVTVLNLDQGRAVPLGIWKGWFMVPAVYALMLVSSFRTKRDLSRLIDVGIAMVSMLALLMLLQFFTGWFGDVSATYDHRLVWPYLDPLSGKGASGNYPALFLGPFLCLAWVRLLNASERLDRLYFLSAVLTMGAVVYWSKSYGAWLSIVGACALTSFLMLSGKKRWIAVPLITLSVVGLMYWDQSQTEKFQFAVDADQENVIGSGEERRNIWQVSLDLIKRDPLWGVGIGQFQKAFQQQAPYTLERSVSRKEINHALHPHNIFLMFWLSGGLLSVVSFVGLLLLLFLPLPKEYHFLMAAPLLYWLSHGLIEVPYWKNDLAVSFWWFAALMLVAQNLNLVTGKVQKGLRVGRELGFPTANIQLKMELDKPYGVYMVFLTIEKKKYRGLLYYGPRNTEGLPENIVCEVTIFDFSGDIYDKKMTFKIGKFIREPMAFSSPEELKAQIEKDVLVAKNISKKAS